MQHPPHPPQAVPLLLKEKAEPYTDNLSREAARNRRVLGAGGARARPHSDEPHGRPPSAAREIARRLAHARRRVASSRAKASFRLFSARQKRGRPPRRRYNIGQEN